MYEAIDSDFDVVLGRLKKEAMISRLVKKYAEDKNVEMLCQSMENGNYEDAFTAAHTIKGLAMNLGFGPLSDSSSEMTERLRAGKYENLEELLERVKTDHQNVIDQIEKLED